MRVLFVHQNFPGQYRHLAPELARRGHDVHALGSAELGPMQLPSGVRYHRYAVRGRNTPGLYPLVSDLESKVLRAAACAHAARALAAEGFVPDVIGVHPGWGEALFLREVWPAARQLHFVELYYAAEGQDLGFDPEFGLVDLVQRCGIVTKNLTLLHGLATMDAGVCPTQWQASTVPAPFRDKLQVLHDGIDTVRARPEPAARFEATRLDGRPLRLDAATEVLSFVNRNLEPARGYHRFMRALPEVMRRRPGVQVVIVGGDGASYSPAAAQGTYRERYLDEVREALGPDALSRVHFVGRVPHAALMALFQIAGAHVYLSQPFVLSWSLLEAMACGAPVIASDTAPVREVVEHGRNGRLVNFFDTAGLADAIVETLAARPAWCGETGAARQTVLARYDLQSVCLPRQVQLVEQLGRG